MKLFKATIILLTIMCVWHYSYTRGWLCPKNWFSALSCQRTNESPHSNFSWRRYSGRKPQETDPRVTHLAIHKLAEKRGLTSYECDVDHRTYTFIGEKGLKLKSYVVVDGIGSKPKLAVISAVHDELQIDFGSNDTYQFITGAVNVEYGDAAELLAQKSRIEELLNTQRSKAVVNKTLEDLGIDQEFFNSIDVGYDNPPSPE